MEENGQIVVDGSEESGEESERVKREIGDGKSEEKSGENDGEKSGENDEKKLEENDGEKSAENGKLIFRFFVLLFF